MDELVEAVEGQYAMFVAALNGRCLQTTSDSVAGFRIDGHALAGTFARNVESLIVAHLAPLASGASEGRVFALQQQQRALVGSLRAVAAGNVTQASRRLFGMEDSASGLLKGMGGSMGVLAQKKLRCPTYKTRDAAGRTWESGLMVRSLTLDLMKEIHD